MDRYSIANGGIVRYPLATHFNGFEILRWSTVQSKVLLLSNLVNLPDSQCQVLSQPPQDGSGYGAQKRSNTYQNTFWKFNEALKQEYCYCYYFTQGGSECGALKQSITYNVQCRAQQVFVTK